MRLRALRDAPHAFSTTAAQTEQWTEAEWRNRLAGRPAFVAAAEGEVVDLV